jgi:hypothetical protein
LYKAFESNVLCLEPAESTNEPENTVVPEPDVKTNIKTEKNPDNTIKITIELIVGSNGIGILPINITAPTVPAVEEVPPPVPEASFAEEPQINIEFPPVPEATFAEGDPQMNIEFEFPPVPEASFAEGDPQMNIEFEFPPVPEASFAEEPQINIVFPPVPEASCDPQMNIEFVFPPVPEATFAEGDPQINIEFPPVPPVPEATFAEGDPQINIEFPPVPPVPPVPPTGVDIIFEPTLTVDTEMEDITDVENDDDDDMPELEDINTEPDYDMPELEDISITTDYDDNIFIPNPMYSGYLADNNDDIDIIRDW